MILAKHPLKLGELSPVFLMILRDSLASSAQDSTTNQSTTRKTVAMHPAIERQIQQARSSQNKKTPVIPPVSTPSDNLSTPNDNVGTPNEKVNIVPVSSAFNTSNNTHRVPITSPLVPLTLSTGAAMQRSLAQNEGKVVVTENQRVAKTRQLLPEELIAYNINCNDLSSGASQRLSQNRVVNDSNSSNNNSNNSSNNVCDANNDSYANAHQSNLDSHNLFSESSASDSSRGHKRKWSDLSVSI